MFFACGIWFVADVSSVSPSLEQTEGLWGNQCLNIVYERCVLQLKKP